MLFHPQMLGEWAIIYKVIEYVALLTMRFLKLILFILLVVKANSLRFRLFPVITKPTQVTKTSQTFIDHIFANITTQTITSGIYQSDITNPFPIFCLHCNNVPKHKKKFDKQGFYRDYKVVSQTLYEEDIKAILANESVLAP